MCDCPQKSVRGEEFKLWLWYSEMCIRPLLGETVLKDSKVTIRNAQHSCVKKETRKSYRGCYRYNHSWGYTQLTRTGCYKNQGLKAITHRDNPSHDPYYTGYKAKDDPWRFSFRFCFKENVKARRKWRNSGSSLPLSAYQYFLET